MACLIKPPTESSRGFLTLTTQERDRLVFGFADIRVALERIKQRYAIGLHHNWHDFDLEYDPLFDFHLAGVEDLREKRGRHIPLLPMDACNFSPPCFVPGREKFWDILFVARAVAFKGIPEFFASIRNLYDQGKRLRVLFICPVPPQDGPGSLRNVRAHYDALFKGEEQELFTLLTTDFRYPFPFDLPTLAQFYRSSRVFVHSAPDERRCRVAAYAWAAGLPVVGMAPVGSVLSPALRRDPYFYQIRDYSEFPEAILDAIAASELHPDFTAVQAEVATDQSVQLLENHLLRLFSELGEHPPVAGGWTRGLDIRMGRHHGLPAGTNRLGQDLAGFLDYLAQAKSSELNALVNFDDPELEIERRNPMPPRELVESSGATLVGRLRSATGRLWRYVK